MPHITGIVAADAVAHYGTDYISGSILIDVMPYRSMHPEVAHPVVMEILPRILTNDAIEFSKGSRLRHILWHTRTFDPVCQHVHVDRRYSTAGILNYTCVMQLFHSDV